MKKILGLTFCLMVASTGFCLAQNGVTADKITLGQSCALTGPAAALGTGMRDGLLAAFAEINAAGGINGRKIELITKDDGYEPDRAIKNTRQLLDDDKVFLLIGEVGTPTSKAVFPIVQETKTTFFGPFTGAEFLRNPYQKYIINVRGSYYQEMERHIQNLVDDKKMKNIACFYQNDGYGKAGLKGVELALEKRGMKLVATGNYQRNTIAVKSALLNIRKGNPDAIIMVGAYKPCAEFIKLAKKVGLKDTTFCNISFVGTEALRNELGEAGEGVIISQVVKFPFDESVPLVKAYTAAMKSYQASSTLGFVSLEGYTVGKLFGMAATKVSGELNNESLISTINATGTFDLGGVELIYGPDDHQGMDDVFLTIIQGGTVKPL